MRRFSLASIFALRLAVTLALAMGAYAALERYRNPEASWSELWVTHVAHVVVLALMLYAVLLADIDRLVARPLRVIRTHLYKVATGRLDLLEVETGVREIAEMEASVNLMVRRMRLGAGDADPHRTALALRDLAAPLRDSAPDAAEAMMNAAAALELLAPPAGAGGRAAAPSGLDADPPPRTSGESGVFRTGARAGTAVR